MNEKAFTRIIHQQTDLQKLKGKLGSFQTAEGIFEIKKAWLFSSDIKLKPYIFFTGKHKRYLGVVLARQSSDLLVMGAKTTTIAVKQKDLEENLNFSMKIIQYRFPNDLMSLKLIVLCEWDNLDHFEKILDSLHQIQHFFLHKLSDLSKNIW